MESNITIGQYLINSLKKIGIDHIFGIPGDYIINFFKEMEKNNLNLIGTCTEQGAAFAADAYARVNGISALCVTYTVGGLNTVNAIAGAYAEKAPVIVISGAPGICEISNDIMLHHSIRDQNSQLNIFKEITVAFTRLDDPYTAAYEIDRVLQTCLKHKRPVYIELPRDMVKETCINPPKKVTVISKMCPKSLEEAIEEVTSILNNAKNPIILAGVEIKRYKLEDKFKKLLEKCGYPYATTFMGKSLIPESHPQFVGVFMGEVGDEDTFKYFENADHILILGTLMTDTNLGATKFNFSQSIYACDNRVFVKHHVYKNIMLGEFLTNLTEKIDHKAIPINFHNEKKKNYELIPENKLTANKFFQRLEAFITPDTNIICDVGDCLFGSAGLHLPDKANYLGPAFYTSMGYAVPACIGTQIKNPSKNTIVIVGDGAFQMTGIEASCYLKYDLKPIIFVVNNYGYTTQRYLKEGSYNNIQNWKYHKITELLGGGLGIEVYTEQDLENALIRAEQNTESYTLININLDKYDRSNTLYKLTSILGKNIEPNAKKEL